LLHLLHHVGWSLSSLSEPQRLKGLSWQLAPLPDGQALLLVFCDEPLPPLDSAFRAYEDLAPVHRLIIRQIAEEGLPTRHLLLVDGDGSAHLLDAGREEVLVAAEGETELAERILPLLVPGALARGSLAMHPRKPERQRARELDDWTRLWMSRIGPASGAAREHTTLLFQWLHLARLAELLGIGPTALEPLTRWGEPGRGGSASRRLLQSFRPLSEHWHLLQGAPLKTIDQLLRRAQESGQLVPCLQSHARLSRAKFSALIFAEAFADEPLRLTGWRHSLVEPVQADAERDPARWLASTLRLQLDEIGFPGVLMEFDRISEDLRLLAREHAVQRQRGERPGIQLDLLGSEPPPLTEEEAPRVTLQSVVQLVTGSRQRAETARLVLLAHAAEWFARVHRPETIFPTPSIEVVAPPIAPQPPPLKPRQPELN
jgi:hypothetical protein